MELTGIITEYRVINGTRSDGTPFNGCEYTIVEQVTAGYPQSVVFSVFGDNYMAWKIKPGQVGTITIRCTVDRNRTTGYKYNKIQPTGWQLLKEAEVPAQQQAAPFTPQPAQQPTQGGQFAAPQQLPFG